MNTYTLNWQTIPFTKYFRCWKHFICHAISGIALGWNRSLNKPQRITYEPFSTQRNASNLHWLISCRWTTIKFGKEVKIPKRYEWRIWVNMDNNQEKKKRKSDFVCSFPLIVCVCVCACVDECWFCFCPSIILMCIFGLGNFSRFNVYVIVSNVFFYI